MAPLPAALRLCARASSLLLEDDDEQLTLVGPWRDVTVGHRARRMRKYRVDSRANRRSAGNLQPAH